MAVSRTMLGFDRKVRLGWLNLTVDRLLLGDDLPALRKRLRHALSQDLTDNGPGGALGKTLTVLLRIWANPSPDQRVFREEALRLYRDLPVDQTVWMHWGMVMATHPFVLGLVTHTGRLLALQNDVSTSEVRRRMIEHWGDRTTLERAVQRAMWNFSEWGVLQSTPKQSVFQATAKRHPPSEAVQTWMIEALLRASNTPCMSLRQIETSPALFPFEMSLVVSEVRKSPRMELMRHGVDVDMVALR